MRWSTGGRVAATALVGLLVPTAVGAVGITRARGKIYSPREAAGPPVPVNIAAPAYDQGKSTAVVVLGSERANVADVLAPYEGNRASSRCSTTPGSDLSASSPPRPG
jgi:hypothetical protein